MHLEARAPARPSDLHGGVRAHVSRRDPGSSDAELVLHRHDALLEAARLPRLRGALLALHGVGVDVGAGEAVLGRDQIGGNALRDEIGFMGDRGIGGPAPPVEPIGTRLMASTPPPMVISASPDFYFRGGDVARLPNREAQKRSICTPATFSSYSAFSTAMREMLLPCSPIGDSARRDRRHRLSSVEIVAVAHGLQHLRRQRQRRHFMQRTDVLAFAARRRDRVKNIGFSHRSLLPAASPLIAPYRDRRRPQRGCIRAPTIRCRCARAEHSAENSNHRSPPRRERNSR